jgi:hypothetical protein
LAPCTRTTPILHTLFLNGSGKAIHEREVLVGGKRPISNQRPRRLIPIPYPERVAVIRIHDLRENLTLFEIAT